MPMTRKVVTTPSVWQSFVHSAVALLSPMSPALFLASSPMQALQRENVKPGMRLYLEYQEMGSGKLLFAFTTRNVKRSLPSTLLSMPETHHWALFPSCKCEYYLQQCYPQLHYRNRIISSSAHHHTEWIFILSLFNQELLFLKCNWFYITSTNNKYGTESAQQDIAQAINY